MFRILITDASYKHSIALQRYIRKSLSTEVELIGHDNLCFKTAKYYGYLDSVISNTSLQDVVMQQGLDMIIPVGAKSVATVSQHRPQLAALPPSEKIAVCLDKNATMALADRVGVPRPRTERIYTVDELKQCSMPCPCVIKPACETEAQGTLYANDENQREKQVCSILAKLHDCSKYGILIQEYIHGSGAGFFALYDHGRPVRIFMHQRLREYPVTGGMSTAARAFYHETLKDYGLRLLSELNWHGVAMVEFKYDEATDKFSLMEINPKFWGSLELALKAGVNFGADLVSVYRGVQLEYSEEYDRQLHFYWPLDGDILNLIYTRHLGKIKEYSDVHAATDVGYSRKADAVRSIRMLAKLTLGR